MSHSLKHLFFLKFNIKDFKITLNFEVHCSNEINAYQFPAITLTMQLRRCIVSILCPLTHQDSYKRPLMV